MPRDSPVEAQREVVGTSFTIVVGYVLYEKTRVNDRREGRLNLTFMDICRDIAMLENSPLNN